ncbi:MAG: phosphomannose isomerase type II C-terminal cupin domain [Candidatus Omnitrophica bacterium]|nr:phosphomannose isomerase type II C-terminal cupin domain [Candidatus Omnitrophota bacterium]
MKSIINEKPKQRPWGTYHKIFQESGVWVKRVEVRPGERLSLQKHKHRSEKWIIVSGEGIVVVNNLTVTVAAGSVVDIPVHVIHRMANIGKEPLVFIEVACGNKLTEEDIIRLQDDYLRKPIAKKSKRSS